MAAERPKLRTLFHKIWNDHKVVERDDGQTLLYVDRHYIHDGSRRAFEVLAEKGLKLRRPDRTFGTPDHYVSAAIRDVAAIAEPEAREMVETIERTAVQHNVTVFGLRDARQVIVHVVGPEQGLTQRGITIVCGDSHTSTHGALGALAFGIGASEVGHVMATQTLWQRCPKTMRISVDGTLARGVFAKDIILAIIAKIGAAGAVGHVIEYAGSAIRGLSMEGRLTVCNMSIEAGARAGMIAPDETTFAYLEGRPFAPKAAAWESAIAHWCTLPSDAGARFDGEVTLDAAEVAPMATWGTSPSMPRRSPDACPIRARRRTPGGAPAGKRRWRIWGSRPGRRSKPSRSTGCSSAPAPTAASRIYASRPRHRRSRGAARDRAFGRSPRLRHRSVPQALPASGRRRTRVHAQLDTDIAAFERRQAGELSWL